MRVRILIVDDHPAIRGAIRMELATNSGWEVCGEAVDGRDAIEKAKSLRPNVVVLDLRMPHLGGLEATPLIKRELPESIILILSQDDTPAMVNQAMRAGASAFVSTYVAHRQLIPAIERALSRQPLADVRLADCG
jgi:DNA-binding NarL/FixJ family response regulator